MNGQWYVKGLMVLATAGAWNVSAPAKLNADPPARVGRLNYMSGTVSFRPAGSDEWAAAVPNRPLTTGDRLWTDNDARAEVHVGSTVIRINAQTELDFTNVDDNTLQLRLAQGSLTIRVRHLDDGQVYEIDAPNGAITIGRTGEYRVDVNADGTSSVVTVWNGDAEVTAAGSSFAVDAHQRATINGTDAPTYDLNDAPGYDEWDQWCVSRDQREDHAVSARYVSREMPGYEDLDQYGHWRDVPGYGDVWVPADVAPGWAPYHTGHWVWVDPWGWTWVDDAPWGYAPYHYGRWAYVDDGYWAWVPGRIVERPVYAPALVVFVGAPAPRPGVSVSIGFGNAVAWFALGPEEVYRPAYVTSPRYVQQVNVTNVTNVTNITNVTNVTNVNNTTNVTNIQYRNRNAPGGMTATSATAFASAKPVQSANVPVTTALRNAPVTGSAPSVVPTRASLAAASSGVAVKAPPTSVSQRPVLANVAPPPAPVPFAAKEQALASNGGKPLAPAQVATIRHSTAQPTAALVKPAAVATGNGGLRAARPELAAATPVTSASSTGYVSAPRSVKVAATGTAAGATTQPSTPPAASGAPSGSSSSAQPSGSTTPPANNKHATGTRVVTGSGTSGTITPAPRNGNAPVNHATTAVPHRPPPGRSVNTAGNANAAASATANRVNTNQNAGPNGTPRTTHANGQTNGPTADARKAVSGPPAKPNQDKRNGDSPRTNQNKDPYRR